MKKNIKKIGKELAIANSVTFTGHVDNKDMPALYQSADIMVNGSLVVNMPISLHEALARSILIGSTTS